MATYGTEILAAANSRLGQPFEHHYKPFNWCANGNLTLAGCMRRGIGEGGYDCSGLIIAAYCDVLGISPNSWPEHFRHLPQWGPLQQARQPEAGDVLVVQRKNPGEISRHAGIVVEGLRMVHASGTLQRVEDGVAYNMTPAGVIPAAVLMGHLAANAGLQNPSFSASL